MTAVSDCARLMRNLSDSQEAGVGAFSRGLGSRGEEGCGKPVSLLLTRAIPDWLCLGGKTQLGLVGYSAFEGHVDCKGFYRTLRNHTEGAFHFPRWFQVFV